jgi:hypothetical protein
VGRSPTGLRAPIDRDRFPTVEGKPNDISGNDRTVVETNTTVNITTLKYILISIDVVCYHYPKSDPALRDDVVNILDIVHVLVKNHFFFSK